MTGLLDTASGLLGRRLLMTTWVPITVFVALIGILVVSATGWSDARDGWTRLPADLRGVAIAFFAAVTVLLTQLLSAIRPAIIRLYEGYWDAAPDGTRRFDRFVDWRRERHDDQAVRKDYPWRLPPKDQRMPTKFGNIIRAAEQEARRYGLDAATAWPRLYLTLPETFTVHFAATSGKLDLTVTISFLGGAFALVGGGFAAFALPWYAILLCVAGGALTAWLGYRAAIHAAVGYGELVRAAFDVHRWLLLDAMGLSRPTSLGTEIEQWKQIQQIWKLGAPDSEKVQLLGYPKVARRNDVET